MMRKALKTISLLLSYPSQELQAEAGALKAALADLAPPVRDPLATLIDEIAGVDLMEAQERYVHLFDRGRATSLHLFEHVHGESRDRGQAMVDLLAMYEENGFAVEARELPDYLPLFLEYLSTRPTAEIEDLLASTAHITVAIGERLEKRGSPYALALRALTHLSEAKPDEKLLADILKGEEDDPDDLAALDRVWEEEAVTFGGGATGTPCGTDRIRTRLRAAERHPDRPSNPASPTSIGGRHAGLSA